MNQRDKTTWSDSNSSRYASSRYALSLHISQHSPHTLCFSCLSPSLSFDRPLFTLYQPPSFPSASHLPALICYDSHAIQHENYHDQSKSRRVNSSLFGWSNPCKFKLLDVCRSSLFNSASAWQHCTNRRYGCRSDTKRKDRSCPSIVQSKRCVNEQVDS